MVERIKYLQTEESDADWPGSVGDFANRCIEKGTETECIDATKAFQLYKTWLAFLRGHEKMNGINEDPLAEERFALRLVEIVYIEEDLLPANPKFDTWDLHKETDVFLGWGDGKFLFRGIRIRI